MQFLQFNLGQPLGNKISVDTAVLNYDKLHRETLLRYSAKITQPIFIWLHVDGK